MPSSRSTERPRLAAGKWRLVVLGRPEGGGFERGTIENVSFAKRDLAK
jgi:hypothetical protein